MQAIYLHFGVGDEIISAVPVMSRIAWGSAQQAAPSLVRGPVACSMQFVTQRINSRWPGIFFRAGMAGRACSEYAPASVQKGIL